MGFASSLILGLLALSDLISSSPLIKRAINSEVFERIVLYEQFAAASYCPNNYNSSTLANKLVCTADLCPEVQAADTSTLLEIPTSLLSDTSGFVAVDKTHGLIVVSFRGSESVRNFLTDLDLTHVDIPLCTNCEGAKGFYTAWVEVQDAVYAAVKAAVVAYPQYSILVTGHSLGAAIATFGAVYLRNKGYTVDMATFGSPRVGTETMVQYIGGQPPSQGKNYRVTHKYDPVPSMPTLAQGYRHIEPEYYITTGNGVTPSISEIEVQMGTSNENPWGPTLAEDGDAHVHYFNHISGCFPKRKGFMPFAFTGKPGSA